MATVSRIRKEKTRAFVDLETTGFNFYGSSVICIAAVIDAPDSDKPDFHSYQIKPTSLKHWSLGAEEVHGISYQEAMKFPDGLEVGKEFLKMLSNYGEDIEFWYHGRNAFDLKFLRSFFFMLPLHYGYYELFKYFPANRHFSTVDIAKKHLQLKGYSLDKVCNYLNIDLKHHDALSDAKAAWSIFKKLEKHIDFI